MTARRHFREIAKDLVAYGLLSVLTPISGLILLPLLTRVLSVQEYGAVDLFATYVALVSVICRLALPSALNRFYHELATDEERRRLLSTLLLFVALVGGAITALAPLALASGVANAFDLPEAGTFVTLGCVVASLNALIALPQAVLRLERRIVLYNVVTVLNAALYLGFTVVFVVQLERGIVGVFAAQALATAVAFGVAAALTRRSMALGFTTALLRRSLVFSLPMVPAVLVTWANEQADRVILVSLSGLGSVAVFGAAAKIAGIFQFAVAIFRQAWQPYSMTLVAAPDRDEVYRTILDCYVAAFVVLGLAFSAIAPELCRVFLPQEYWIGYVLVPWMTGSALLQHSTTITNLGILVSERTSHVLIASVFAVVVNIGLSIPLIMRFGVVGAALGAFVAQLGLAVLLVHFSNRLSSLRFHRAPMLWSMALYVAGAYALLRCADLSSAALSVSLRGAVVVAAGVLVYRVALDAPTREFLRSLVRRESRPPSGTT